MPRSPRHPTAVLVAIAAVLAVAVPSASAAGTEVSGGATTLRLDRSVTTALQRLDLTVSTSAGAKATRGGISFPIRGGRLDGGSAKGRVTHRGAVTLGNGDSHLTLSRPILRTSGRTPSISARVNGGRRVTVLRLTTRGARLSRPDTAIRIRPLVVRLSAGGASALNRSLGIRVFSPGRRIGRATVLATPKTLQLAGGKTTLSLDPGTAGTLAALGIAVLPVPPSLQGEARTYVFPVAGRGGIDARTKAGAIDHDGGLLLTRGDVRVALTSPVIRLGPNPRLTARINGSSPVNIATLDVGALRGPTREDGRFVIAGITAALTPEASTALNAAFGTTEIVPGLALGGLSSALELD